MRAQLGFDGRLATLRSRRGRDCTAEFPQPRALTGVLDEPVVLDGELVCLDREVRPDFERLRARTAAAITTARRGGHADDLRGPASGRPLDTGWPYRERHSLLDGLGLDDAAWRTPRAFATDEDLAAVTRERQLEGVGATRLDARCQPGQRGDAWLKHKHRHRQRLTITAWRPGDRREPGELTALVSWWSLICHTARRGSDEAHRVCRRRASARIPGWDMGSTSSRTARAARGVAASRSRRMADGPRRGARPAA